MEDARFKPLISISLDWLRDGNEWLKRFDDALRNGSELGVYGGSFSPRKFPPITITTKVRSDPDSEYRLYIVPCDKSLLLLTREGDKVPMSTHDAWADAAASAVQNIGTEDPAHRWSAIIGKPAGVSGGNLSLAHPGEIGPLTFEPSDKALVEITQATERPSLIGGGLDASFPILVKGSNRGYSWGVASASAARDLNRACGLLSTAWGSCITVRESPAPLDWGVRKVPDHILGINQELSDSLRERSSLAPQSLVEIPSWSNQAWGVISNKPRIAHAVTVFREGLRAQEAHPSLALVAFISSIEAISQVIFREDKCKACRSPQGIAAKFRETIRLTQPEEVANILTPLYSPRSYTVHQGRLHGHEPTIGAFLDLDLWASSEANDFRYKLSLMGEASRSILTLALHGQLPPKRVFEFKTL